MKYFCTLFDQQYLEKGILMVSSLMRAHPSSFIYILALDYKTYLNLLNLKISKIKPILLEDIEDDALLEAKSNRSWGEFCWTLASFFTHKVITENKSIDLITYLDADLYFYGDISPIFEEIGNNSIGIIPHRFPTRLNQLELYGKFCVQWCSFRRDQQGLECLTRWKDQCLEWCYDYIDGDRMGDQKYLDEWPKLYPSCKVIENIGAGLAPWNFEQFDIVSELDGTVLVNGEPLIFYHFHGLKILKGNKIFRCKPIYTKVSGVPEIIYKPYESKISDLLMYYRKDAGAFDIFQDGAFFVKIYVHKFFPPKLKRYLKLFLKFIQRRGLR